MKISSMEWKIMKLLWQQPMTITQLTKALSGETGWGKENIIRFLKRMQEKNTVYYEEGEKAKLFFPNITREEAEREETTEMLDRVFDGSRSLMLSSLVKSGSISEKEINELCELLHLRRLNDEYGS